MAVARVEQFQDIFRIFPMDITRFVILDSYAYFAESVLMVFFPQNIYSLQLQQLVTDAFLMLQNWSMHALPMRHKEAVQTECKIPSPN